MLPLALLLCVLPTADLPAPPGPGAGARPPAPPAPTAAPAAPAPRARPAPFALWLEGLDPDVVGFLTTGRGTSAIDGGTKIPWDGPDGSLLRSSWDALDKRIDQVMVAEPILVALDGAVRAFYLSGGQNLDQGRTQLLETSAGLDRALAAYQRAVELEERRLFLVKKATDMAAMAKDPIPGIDVDLVDRRLTALLDGRIAAGVELRVQGYRALSAGLVAYVDGEALTALEKMKTAAEALPDLAVAHAYLGSLYYLFRQTDAAVKAWKRALALDPANESVQAALREYGGKGR